MASTHARTEVEKTGKAEKNGASRQTKARQTRRTRRTRRASRGPVIVAMNPTLTGIEICFRRTSGALKLVHFRVSRKAVAL